MKYSKKVAMAKAADRATREEQIIELKCFLKKPMEADLQTLIDEFNEMCRGKSDEPKIIEQAPVVEKVQSLEDWFSGL